jgi:hypothetical protein
MSFGLHVGPLREPIGKSLVRGAKSATPGLRLKPDLSRQFKLICPVQTLLQKYFCFLRGQITCLFFAIPSRERGRWPSSLTLGRGAVDADALLTNSA